MNKPPSFPFYVRDFLASEKVLMMSNNEIGSYVLLLCYCWDWVGLPDDEDVIKRIGRIENGTSFERVWSNFEEIEDKMWNKKLHGLYQDSLAYRESQSIKGKLGGRPPKPTDKPGLNSGKADVKPFFASSFLFSSFLFLLSVGLIPNPKKKSIKDFLFKVEYLELAELLRDCVVNNDPKLKIESKQLCAWANDVRLMVDRDGRTVPEILKVLEFSQNDDFWRGNILSMGKLRKQFSQLMIKSKAPRNRTEERQRKNYEATVAYMNKYKGGNNNEQT